MTPVSNPRGGSWSADGTIVFSESVGPLQRIRESAVHAPPSRLSRPVQTIFGGRDFFPMGGHCSSWCGETDRAYM